MSRFISRRTFLGAGTAAAGTLFNALTLRNAHAWPPGPEEYVKKDLKPGNTPIRLGTFLLLDPNAKQDPAAMVEELAKNGYTGYFVDRYTTWENIPDSQLQAFKAALKQYDAVVFEVPGYTNMLNPDKAARQENLKGLAKSIETADRLGCPMVGTISGSCDNKTSGINVHPDNWTESTWKVLVDGVKQVLKDTAGMKAALGMEAQVTTNLDGPKAQRRLMDDVGDSRCAVNFDPTNMISLANYYHTTELLQECFGILGEGILGAHAKDTYILPDSQTVHVQEVCPGRGVMDYETFLVGLSRLKWSRTLMPEHFPVEQVPEAITYIKKVAEKVGVKLYKA